MSTRHVLFFLFHLSILINLSRSEKALHASRNFRLDQRPSPLRPTLAKLLQMTAVSSFHHGELYVQERAGTRGVADELGAWLSPELHAHMGIDAFFGKLRVAWISSVSETSDGNGGIRKQVWVSPLFGNPGFLKAINPKLLSIDMSNAFPSEDILWDNLSDGSQHPVGFIALDFEIRRRYRTNGYVTGLAKGATSLDIQVVQAFPNCPKYIQNRVPLEETSNLSNVCSSQNHAGTQFQTDLVLNKGDMNVIAESDTFFFGTFFEATGADVNHRGGQPGFVRVLSEKELLWPDYRGNGMFQSFGNLAASNQAGVTFFDFSSGQVLQLTGQAEVIWDPSELDIPLEAAARRAVRFRIESVRRSVGPATNFRWKTVEYSPYNPVVLRSGNVKRTLESKDGNVFPIAVKLVKVIEESRSVKTFRFLSPVPLKFLPGQYATFEFEKVKGMKTNSSYINRTWTLSECSNSTEKDVTLEISVKRKTNGPISTWLHEHAQVGLEVKLLGIGGEMTPFKKKLQSKLLLISGGIGITPNMAILRGIGIYTSKNDNPDVVFMHQERDLRDVPFQEEIERRALASEGRTKVVMMITSHPVIGRETASRNFEIRQGRIDSESLKQYVADVDDRDVYLCGPDGFMRTISTALGGFGVLSERIVTEDFNF